MNKPTYKIEGPAGEKYSCLVPQKKHSFPALGFISLNVDEITIAQADVLFEKSKDFLVLNQKPEAGTGAAAKNDKKN